MLPSSNTERESDASKPGLFLVNLSIEQQLTSLGSVFHSAPVGLCVLDLQFRYMTVNACFAKMYRRTVEEFQGRTVQEVLPGPAPQIMAHLAHVLETDRAFEAEITLTLPVSNTTSGETEELTYLRSAQPVRSPSGQVVGLSVALLDITSRKRAEAALRESEQNLRFTVELTPHIPWTANSSGELIFISPRWHAMTGQKPGESFLRDWIQVLHPADRLLTAKVWQHSVDTGEPYDREYRVRSSDGSWLWMRARAYPRREESGAIVRWYGMVEDIHERKTIEVALQEKTEELARRAQEDYLTGLANRRRFDDVLGREVERARRSKLPLGLVLIDVDYFKRYNDTQGHLAGDACLKMVALALGRVIRRPGDLVARFGGEEFAILLPNTSAEGAFEIALSAIRAVDGLELGSVGPDGQRLTISAGVAMFVAQPGSPPETDAEALVQAADSALYRSKAEGRNRVTAA